MSREAALARAAQRASERGRELLERHPDTDPKFWPDHDKLRLIALVKDREDIMRGSVGQDEVQVDLRRIAERIERCTCHGT